MIPRPVLSLCATCLIATALPAEEPAAEAVVRPAARVMTATEDGFTGPGAAFLRERARAARFVLVGEPHYTRETARLTRWLGEEGGFDVFAVETGPVTAARLADLARKGRGAFETLLERRPRSFPFFDAPEEIEILTAFTGRGMGLWGLDQEFFFSARFHLERLRDLARGETARALTERELARAEASFAAAEKEDAEAAPWLAQASAEDFAALRLVFEAERNLEALAIVEAMAESWQVYKLWNDGEVYRSNARRIALMKEYFYRNWQTAPRPPRVLFKFGSMHMGKGATPLHMLDLGNLAHELALSLGGESFHLEVTGAVYRRGEGEEQSMLEWRPELAAVFAACPGDRWCVVDLAALRPSAFRDEKSPLPAALRDTAWRYDALVVAPVLQRAERLP